MSPRWSHLPVVLPPARDDLVPGGLPEAAVPRAVQMTVQASVKEPSWASVIEWSVIDGRRPEPTSVVAAGHGVTVDVLRHRLRTVRAQGGRAVFPAAVWTEASRASRIGEVHEARRRWAYLLHLPEPEPAPEPAPLRLSVVEHRLIRTATKVLAAVGPLSLAELTVSVQQAHTASPHPPVTESELARILRSGQAAEPDEQGRWGNLKDVAAHPRHLALTDAARDSGRTVHSTAQLRELLAAAGYTTFNGPTVYNNPLVRHLGRNRWLVLTRHPA